MVAGLNVYVTNTPWEWETQIPSDERQQVLEEK